VSETPVTLCWIVVLFLLEISGPHSLQFSRSTRGNPPLFIFKWMVKQSAWIKLLKRTSTSFATTIKMTGSNYCRLLNLPTTTLSKNLLKCRPSLLTTVFIHIFLPNCVLLRHLHLTLPPPPRNSRLIFMIFRSASFKMSNTRKIFRLSITTPSTNRSHSNPAIWFGWTPLTSPLCVHRRSSIGSILVPSKWWNALVYRPTSLLSLRPCIISVTHFTFLF